MAEKIGIGLVLAGKQFNTMLKSHKLARLKFAQQRQSTLY
jgi:hypothetical protein